MDEVEIKNVGGLRGVASEATLQLLVDTIKAQSGTRGSNPQSSARLQDLYTRSVKNSTTEQKKYTKAIADATKSLGKFTKEVLITNQRISDFTGYIPLLGGVITSVVQYGEHLVDTFRELSSVGASFNNNMFDVLRSSANASMNLDDFASMIRNNSQELARFGGTATKGSQFIGEFSRDIRLGIGQRFFDMGLTISDINEGLIDFLSLETMRGKRNLRNDSALQTSAANYILQLDKLSKLTGLQREALVDAQMALQTDAQVRNQIARVEKSRGQAAAEELRAIYTVQSKELPEFHSALMDLSDGVAQSDLGKALGQIAPGLREFQMAVARGDITQEEYLQAMQTRFIPAIEAYASTVPDASLQVYRSLGGFNGALAQIIDGTYQFSNLMNRNSTEATAEQRRTSRLTSLFAQFEQALINLRKTILDDFLDSAFAKKLATFGEDLVKMFDESGSGAFGQAGRGIRTFVRNLFSEHGMFTTALDWVSNFITSGKLGDALRWMADQARAIGDWFKGFVANVETDGFWKALEIEFGKFIDYLFGKTDEATGERSEGALARLYSGSWLENAMTNIIDTLFGKPVTDMTNPAEPTIREGGLFDKLFEDQGVIQGTINAFTKLFETIGTAFTNFWEGDTGKDIKETIENYFRDVMLRLLKVIDSIPFVDLTDELDSLLLQTRRKFESGEEITPTQGRMLREQLEERRNSLAGGIDSAWDRLWTTDEQIAETQRYIEGIDQLLNDLTERGFAKGTKGFKDFSNGTLTMLHGTEAVVPINSPEGKMLSAFYSNSNSLIPKNNLANELMTIVNQLQQTQTNSTAANQSKFRQADQAEVANKLDELNTNVNKMIDVMRESVSIQSRTMKNLRGVGTDMFRGAGF